MDRCKDDFGLDNGHVPILRFNLRRGIKDGIVRGWYLVVSIFWEPNDRRSVLHVDGEASHTRQRVGIIAEISQQLHHRMSNFKINCVPETNRYEWTGIVTVFCT